MILYKAYKALNSLWNIISTTTIHVGKGEGESEVNKVLN